MVDTQIQLAALWVVLMLVFLLGDVIRIFSGDTKPGEIEGKKVSQAVWLGISVVMLMPILMILVSIFLPYSTSRGVNIAAAVLWFLFNLFGLPTYRSAYDKFLIIVGLIINVFTVIVAWNWS